MRASWLYLLHCALGLLCTLRAVSGFFSSASGKNGIRTASASLSMKTVYRNAKEGDLAGIAELVAETFDGPFGFLQGMQKKASYDQFQEQFSGRYNNLVLGGKKHAMFVAVDEETERLEGFLEIGGLPSPIPVDVKFGGITMPIVTDVPYLGNVAVSEDSRRKGIASRMIRIGEKVAQKWGDKYICAAVDCDNQSALSMYKKLNFNVVRDERDNMNRSMKNPPRLFVLKSFDVE
ncbi:acyl-CoA N-acyltransferase [Ochromonadaceae sp. CCMP2298]|nr:acyl-CoA N-acyltransferase [Ochromonadaceae sp. CCMP2298]|mmetsp:Transcript_11276/g.25078  ORF Transcript_11276/g.25078 Transcript_11276/m.25078 type:complete len:234 (+) Transcript_11276:67-768(+)